MGGNGNLRRLAVAAAALFQHSQRALALPQAGNTVAGAPRPWVTVDPSGVASTVTPAVITTQGHRATVLEAPSSLISTATYTISPDGRLSTYTGLPPVAEATGSTEAGVFLACGNENNVGPDAPFCQPRRGSTLHPGRTYYITWSPMYFSPSSALITFQTIYPDTNDGFQSDPFPAARGFYAWSIPADFLATRPGSPEVLNVSFQLAQDDASTPDVDNDVNIYPGPLVYVTSSDEGMAPASGESGSGGPNAAAIAVPVVVVVALLLVGGACYASWRRRGTVPVLAALKRRSTGGAGYGARQSRSERMGAAAVRADNKSETDVGVELTDRDSWSPTARTATGGRNVFREEVERQERQARLG
ncbi:hypothetical protein MMYC01_200837 [Madurella mycetomatis]|uniref:Uncharacterized protein n=1 Tax=Madurella mycetomatis TaxID=100816 RepID=A0A175WGQ3_9PEZI|nr:hypothetical protein MMYC01_200837 [Madurella mycetomatis]